MENERIVCVNSDETWFLTADVGKCEDGTFCVDVEFFPLLRRSHRFNDVFPLDADEVFNCICIMARSLPLSSMDDSTKTRLRNMINSAIMRLSDSGRPVSNDERNGND